MKTLLEPRLQSGYETDLWRIRVGLLRKFGTQKAAAKALCIPESNLSKILSGTIDCNCRLFWLICQYSGMFLCSTIFEDL